MGIHCGQSYLMLDTERRNPQIIFRDQLALLSEQKPKPRIDLGRRRGDVQDPASTHEPLNFSEIVVGAARVESSVSQFPNDRHWK